MKFPILCSSKYYLLIIRKDNIWGDVTDVSAITIALMYSSADSMVMSLQTLPLRPLYKKACMYAICQCINLFRNLKSCEVSLPKIRSALHPAMRHGHAKPSAIVQSEAPIDVRFVTLIYSHFKARSRVKFRC